MKHFLLLLCTLSSLLNAENTLVVSLINDSAMKFVFERSAVEFPNNTLTIDKKVLVPGDTATITGTTTLEEDLSGVLYFKDNASFWILDKRQFHVGPPIFSFVANVSSMLISKTPNSEVGALLLSYVAAKVLIQD